MKLLDIEVIFLIHKKVINVNELQGLARDKSLEAALNRVENRINYGVIQDGYDLAATYTVVIARGHVFNAANKRTAFKAMEVCLKLNNIFLSFDEKITCEIIVKVAQGSIDEIKLAYYLRNLK